MASVFRPNNIYYATSKNLLFIDFATSFILLVSIVGSGIAGQQYTNDQMVILFSHAVVIGFTLIFIIRIFAN